MHKSLTTGVDSVFEGINSMEIWGTAGGLGVFLGKYLKINCKIA